MQKKIVIKGAKEHNLKNVSVEVPKDKFVVITGISGSGKSSLAFDTIYAEGQRRYVESLSAYARQFLDKMKKPNVDLIEGFCPAIAIEIQNALGIKGFAFDMNVACSSATFGIQTIFDMVKSGSIKSAIMINPEICTGHLNFRDRDCHFIFGDVATAVILERLNEENIKENSYEIIGTRLLTKFSNNIRNNYGFLNNSSPDGVGQSDKLFHQNGRKVFKEVVPEVSNLIKSHLEENNLSANDLKGMYLHQANENMNVLISKYVLGKDAPKELAPVVLDEYANTSSAGSIIAFHKYNKSLNKNDLAIICSFGAGYSVGNVIVKKIA